MVTEKQIIEAYVPESIKQASRNFQMNTVVSAMIGLNDFTFDKIAAYMGGRFAARRLKWRPVADGLVALQQLQE